MTNWDYEASRCAIGNLPGQHPPKESVNESPERAASSDKQGEAFDRWYYDWLATRQTAGSPSAINAARAAWAAPRLEGQTIEQWAERAKISERNLHEYMDATVGKHG